MADHLRTAQMACARTEIAKAKSLRDRIESHGSRMSADAREIIWAMIFAHENAVEELLEAVEADK
jgi:plasmid stability protein